MFKILEEKALKLADYYYSLTTSRKIVLFIFSIVFCLFSMAVVTFLFPSYKIKCNFTYAELEVSTDLAKLIAERHNKSIHDVFSSGCCVFNGGYPRDCFDIDDKEAVRLMVWRGELPRFLSTPLFFLLFVPFLGPTAMLCLIISVLLGIGTPPQMTPTDYKNQFFRQLFLPPFPIARWLKGMYHGTIVGYCTLLLLAWFFYFPLFSPGIDLLFAILWWFLFVTLLVFYIIFSGRVFAKYFLGM